MQSNWFQNICKENILVSEKGIWIDKNIATWPDQWSFSQEWKQHSDEKQVKTWGLTAQQRLDQFYIETKSGPAEIKEKMILDAGCGNGLLTKALAESGAYVVGIDMHSELPGKLSSFQLQFVRADFDKPPFKEKTFDIVIANGSIHHTRNTFTSFQALASLVNEGGKLYVWLYKRPSSFYKRFLLWWLDFFRFIISRLPVSMRKISVNILTAAFYSLSRIRKGDNSKRTKEEIRINIYDAFTPRYRHYHNPVETAQWFYKCKFDNPVLTHWDNQYGFGMFAVRNSNRSEPAEKILSNNYNYMHTHHHEEEHLRSSDFLRDIVIGMSDGLTVPFALAAGLSGAVDSTAIIVIAGIAEIAAGSIAMGLGGFLAGKTEQDHYNSELKREYDEVEKVPQREKEEVMEFFEHIGLSEEMQVQATEEISKDKEKWVDFMMKYELGLDKPDPKRATKSAMNIGLSYVVGGLVPLSPYFFITTPVDALKVSVVVTLICLFIFGYFKSKITGVNPLGGGLRVTLIGALAAAAAFGVAKLF